VLPILYKLFTASPTLTEAAELPMGKYTDVGEVPLQAQQSNVVNAEV
jgi:hypothetical protein